MHHREEPTQDVYPHGRGYGHDYMRGGEVLGGYGYSEREEYALRRGELYHEELESTVGSESDESEPSSASP